MQIIILAAGAGKRFVDNRIFIPKPLIKVKEKTLLQHAYESLKLQGNYIFVCQKQHEEEFKISQEIYSLCKDAKIVFLNKLSKGPAESALFCNEVLDEEDSLITINCDQRMVWDERRFIDFLNLQEPDGCIITVKTNGKNYSYAEVNEAGIVQRIVEKEIISDDGLIGFHYYKKAKYFIDATRQLISLDQKQKGEFYISDTYNILIKNNLRIMNYSLNEKETQIVLGTPEEIKKFESI